jgi:hypothetical protein
VLLLETAQHVSLAQQCGLQPSVLGPFERMQEAAGSCSGLTNIARTTANRIGAVFRMADIYHKRPDASNALATPQGPLARAKPGQALIDEPLSHIILSQGNGVCLP